MRPLENRWVPGLPTVWNILAKGPLTHAAVRPALAILDNWNGMRVRVSSSHRVERQDVKGDCFTAAVAA